MTKEELQKLIETIKLQIKVLQLQLQLMLGQKVTIPNLPGPDKIIVHHGGGFLDFDGVNRYHQMRWGFKSSLGFYAGYGYFIERDGKTIQARADNETQAHTIGQNKSSIGICLMGNGEERDFTFEQYLSLENLLDKKRLEYGINKNQIYGHLNFAATLCPSKLLYDWLLKYKFD